VQIGSDGDDGVRAKTFKASLAAACPGSCPRSSDLWIDLDGSLVRSVKAA